MTSEWRRCCLLLALAAGATLLAGTPADAKNPTAGDLPEKPVDEAKAESGNLVVEVEFAADSHWIGILCREADGLLRSHLKLDGGLVVEHVVPNGPAAKAGIREHDVLLKFGDASLSVVTDLVEAVKKTRDQEVTVTLLREGEKVSLKVTAAKRPSEQRIGMPVVPKPDREAIQRWLRESIPGEGFEGPLRWRMFGPGVVIDKGDFAKLEFPKNLSIAVTKSGDEPAKIVVKQGDRTWETTEDKLGELPKEVRPHVQRLLGRKSPWNVWPELLVDPGSEVGPRIKRRLDIRPGQPHVLRPQIRVERLDEVEKRIERKMEEMQRMFDELRKDIDQMKKQPVRPTPKKRGVHIEVRPLKPLKTTQSDG